MTPNAPLVTALAGRYTIDREIGRGGMATVYLARDVRHNRAVALKVLNPELGAVLGVERFLAEIEVTANLQHPNLLPLFDSGEANGLLYYVMPFVQGESLRARLDREKQLPVDEAVRITTAIAGALDYAHRHKVIHRDLKPENILMQEGQPLIADFGIALAVSKAGGERITQTGLSLGTPQYMSPEQATGDRVVDGRTDIYSLGAMLYEMLVGDPPHHASTSQAIIAKVLTERPTSARTSRPSVPPHVDAVVIRALEKLAADRFATAKEFADALEGKSSATTASASFALANKPRTRLRDPVMIIGTALLLGTTALAGWQWTQTDRAVADPVIRFPIELPQYVSSGLPIGSGVAISQDGGTIAYIGGTAGLATQQVFVRTMDDITPRPVAGTEGAQALFFSPDGRWLGFWVKGRLYKVALDGSAPRQLADAPVFDGASWSSNGFIVASVAGRLVTIPEGGGAFTPLTAVDTTSDQGRQLYPMVLADGETALYTSAIGDAIERHQIAVVSLSKGQTTLLGVVGNYPLGVVNGNLVYSTSTNQLMAVEFDSRQRRVRGTPIQVGTTVTRSFRGTPMGAVSGGGTLVYQSGSRASEIVLVDTRGSARPLLSESRVYAYPRFSPDGRQIAFSIEAGAGRNVWLYDLASQTLVKFTDDETSERPEWTPDGKRILYRTMGVRSLSSIWWRSADLSTVAAPLFAAANELLWEAVMTPDGSGVVMQRDDPASGNGGDVVLRSTAGDTAVVVISGTKAVENQARPSPDGRWVAFQSNASGSNQVVVQSLRGSGGQVVVSTTAGSEPVWSRDGKRLYYRDGRQFVEVAFTTSPEFRITSRTPLFADNFVFASSPHANYDVSPGGTDFLVLRETEGRQLVLVHNWRAELTRQMAAKGRL